MPIGVPRGYPKCGFRAERRKLPWDSSFVAPPGWWNGRHGGLKSHCSKGRVGSSPTPGTSRGSSDRSEGTTFVVSGTLACRLLGE